MALRRVSGMRLWRRIAEELEGEIARGVYKAGERLPTEHKMADRFGVNRHTVRQAMASLADSGLIQVEQGRGMFVANRPVDYRIGPRTRFSEQLLSGQHRPVRRLVSSARIGATGQVAEDLAIPEDAPIWRLEILSTADERPFSFATCHFPAERFPGLPDIFAETGSVTASFARFGITDYRRRATRITAKPAGTRDVELLGVARGKPLLITENVDVDENGAPIECGASRVVAENVVLTVDG